MKAFVFGIVVTIVAVAATVYLYFATGMALVATSDSPMPLEKKFARIALHARLEVETPTQVPVAGDQENLVAGAHIYLEQPAVCHGVPRKERTAVAKGEFPRPPHLFIDKGVTDDDPGETLGKGAQTVSGSGMPGFHSGLFTTRCGGFPCCWPVGEVARICEDNSRKSERRQSSRGGRRQVPELSEAAGENDDGDRLPQYWERPSETQGNRHRSRR
jgi:thiosulfate dehydrogenase